MKHKTQDRILQIQTRIDEDNHCFSLFFLSFLLPQRTDGVGPNHAVIVLHTMNSDYSKIMQMLNLTGDNLFSYQWTKFRRLPGKILFD